MNARSIPALALAVIGMSLAIAATPARALTIARDGAVYVVMNDRLHRSTDNGATWTAVSGKGGTDQPTWVTSAPDGSVYAMGWHESRQTLFRSTDQGATWKRCGIDRHPESQPGYPLFTPQGMYVGSNNGLARSTDHCATFKWLSRKLPDPAIAADAGGTMYAGTLAGIFLSRDHGTSWERVPGKPFEEGQLSALHVVADGTLFAAVNFSGFFRSADRGRTWQPTGQGLPARAAPLAVLSAADAILIVATGSLYRSTDQGASWKPFGQGLEKCGMLASLARAPDGTLFATCVPAGVFRSTDRGNTWRMSLPMAKPR